MATYAKGLARRASLTEGSVKAAKSYKAKVASLTSERASLQAQIRELTEELVKHMSDLKHTSVARARAEDKEKEARKDAKVAEDNLLLAREVVRPSRVTCRPRWQPWSGPAKRLWRRVTLLNA